MQLEAEFTTEPFEGEGDPPQHALSALEAARASGLDCDFGPFGTRISGDGERLLPALQQVIAAALQHGATRVTMQVQAAGGKGGPNEAAGGDA